MGTSDQMAPDILADAEKHDDSWLKRFRDSVAKWASEGPVFFRSSLKPVVWRQRMASNGNIEIGVTPSSSPKQFVTVFDIDSSGNVRIAGSLTQEFVFPAPGR